MAKSGNLIMKDNGTIGILPSGKIATANQCGDCPTCCCKPKLIASFTTSNSQTWDLSNWYNKECAGKSGHVWRLTNNYMGYVAKREGIVDENGVLVGLPASISPTTYKYTWYFRLEIGCRLENGTILWPNPEQDQDDDSDYESGE